MDCFNFLELQAATTMAGKTDSRARGPDGGGGVNNSLPIVSKAAVLLAIRKGNNLTQYFSDGHGFEKFNTKNYKIDLLKFIIWTLIPGTVCDYLILLTCAPTVLIILRQPNWSRSISFKCSFSFNIYLE